MKRVHLLSLLLTMTAGMATAQTDVTSQYVGNASFEKDDVSTLTAVNNSADGLRGYTLNPPTGWTEQGTAVTSLLVTKDCYTDNNFGKVTTVPDGSKAFYLRMGWATGSTTLQQTLSALPKGRYRLTMDLRSAYANSATSSYQLFAGTQSASFAFSQGSASYFTTAAWQTRQLDFETTADGDVQVGLTVNWLSGGSCIMVDNVTLTRLPDGYVEPDEPTEADVKSVTEGVITGAFVDEGTMMDDLLKMVAKFATYLVNDYKDAAATNSVGEACGCFQSNSSMQANEDGVRSNADLSMVTAFLCKYGPAHNIALPDGITYDQLRQMALRSLVFAYSTHKANKLKVCAGNAYWGSLSSADHTWESSLWAMSVAYSAFFQWDQLSDKQKGYIEALLKAECNYELQRSIPTGYAGDTKAEENGWEVDVLAATLGLFPNDSLAPQWFARLREFAINSYSHATDADDRTVIDPDYDKTTVADLYRGKNLYDDYTLQNHNYFHTSYQNVVIQELGEAALALKLFQQSLYGQEKWKTNALMHNNLEVQRNVLNYLALADGELAMPNGNDWSLFLYDQLTSYTTNAAFLRDPDALMLENLAYKMIQARQQTTTDGSWLLRSDIGARRMGVEAHRVMMTWLMHSVSSTADLTPSRFEDFRERYDSARVFTTQNIVRAFTPERFTTFAWQPGISSYTGYIAANSVDKNKIIVPYKANNTGNFLGWYTVSGKKTNATPVVSGIYQLNGTAWAMNGELNTNDASLNNRFAIYSTPGNAVIYLDEVRALTSGTISKEQGGLMAISVDPFTKPKRTLYYDDTHKQSDGTTLLSLSADWVNIDNALGIVAHNDGKQMAFGDQADNNSILTAKLYSCYATGSRAFKTGQSVDRRNVVYYSNLSANGTRGLSRALVNLKDSLPAGWNGVMAADSDSVRYLLVANFNATKPATIHLPLTTLGYPVLRETATDGQVTLVAEQNNSVAEEVRFFVDDPSAVTCQSADNPNVAYVKSADGRSMTVRVTAVTAEGIVTKTVVTRATVRLTIQGGELLEEAATFPVAQTDTLTTGYTDVTADYLRNANFEDDATYGTLSTNVTASGVTYGQCYTNSVGAVSSSWPNILPVMGWQSDQHLASGSNYCRMYSMPYSETLFCVSPSSVGNYAAKVSPMVADDSCGVRALTVLNSWASGANAIRQVVSLPAGTYRLLLDMRYDCPNQLSNDGRMVSTANNVNTSLTGVSVNGTDDYRFPTTASQWQVMAYDFTLPAASAVTVSLGFSTSAAVGAANNTLLYIDNVRLLRKVSTGISTVPALVADTADGPYYNLAGQRIERPTSGIYISRMGRKKVVR